MGIARLRSEFGTDKTKAITAYIESMCQIPAGSMDGKQVEAFDLGATPVTWEIWDEFHEIERRTTDKPKFANPDHPVVHVDLAECKHFCFWLTNVTGIKFMLPSSIEFEYAARDGGKIIEFPWGNRFDNNKLWCSIAQERSGTAPVKRINNIYINSYGLSDMAGNVSQWCSDSTGSSQNIRGGSWLSRGSGSVYFRCKFKDSSDPSFQQDSVGFRLSSR